MDEPSAVAALLDEDKRRRRLQQQKHPSSSPRLEKKRRSTKDWLCVLLITIIILVLAAGLFCGIYFITAHIFESPEVEDEVDISSEGEDNLINPELFFHEPPTTPYSPKSVLSPNLYKLKLYSNDNNFQTILDNKHTNVVFENEKVAILTFDSQPYKRAPHNGDTNALIVLHKARSLNLFSTLVAAQKRRNTTSLFTQTILEEIKQRAAAAKRVVQNEGPCFSVNLFDAQLVTNLPWTVDPTNPFQFNPEWLYYQSKKTMDTWQSLTSRRLWGSLVKGATMTHINASTPSSFNGLRFAVVQDSQGRTNTILAITISWYRSISGGFEIFHWNQLYNTGIPYGWGDSAQEDDVFDLPSTLTHEFGHTLGLRDIYDTEDCQDVTMFFSGSLGDTDKRTLEQGDRDGFRELYPAPNGAVPTFYSGLSSPPAIHTTGSSGGSGGSSHNDAFSIYHNCGFAMLLIPYTIFVCSF